MLLPDPSRPSNVTKSPRGMHGVYNGDCNRLWAFKVFKGLARRDQIRDLEFQAAVFRMLILPQLVSDVDDGTLLKPKRLDARRPIPAQGRPTGAPRPLGQLQTYVTILDGRTGPARRTL